MSLVRKGKLLVRRFIRRDYRPKLQIILPTERYGTVYGGWSITPNLINADSIVYSFGVGEDISFDTALIEKYGVTVHAFDPTPKSIDWVKGQDTPIQLILHEYGLAEHDGTAKFFPPDDPAHVSHSVLTKANVKPVEVAVRKLETICSELGHSHIDVLKMDIEGAEYAVIDSILQSKIKIKQILIEFHHFFDSVPLSETQTAMSKLNEAGYKLFHLSESSYEYAFIKID